LRQVRRQRRPSKHDEEPTIAASAAEEIKRLEAEMNAPPDRGKKAAGLKLRWRDYPPKCFAH